MKYKQEGGKELHGGTNKKGKRGKHLKTGKKIRKRQRGEKGIKKEKEGAMEAGKEEKNRKRNK